MDKIVNTLVGLGVPGLVLLVAMHVAGYAGGATLTVALASIGPGGMVAGIGVLVCSRAFCETAARRAGQGG